MSKHFYYIGQIFDRIEILERSLENFDYDYYETLNDYWAVKNILPVMNDFSIGQEHFREHILALFHVSNFNAQVENSDDICSKLIEFVMLIRNTTDLNLKNFLGDFKEFAKIFPVYILKLNQQYNNLQEASLEARLKTDKEFFKIYQLEVELLGLIKSDISDEETRRTYLLNNKSFMDSIFKEINKMYGDFSYHTAFGLKVLSTCGLINEINNMGAPQFINLLNSGRFAKKNEGFRHGVECYRIAEKLAGASESFKQSLIDEVIQKSKKNKVIRPGLIFFLAGLSISTEMRLSSNLIKFLPDKDKLFKDANVNELLHYAHIHNRVCAFLKISEIEIGNIDAINNDYLLTMADLKYICHKSNSEREEFILKFFELLPKIDKEVVFELLLDHVLFSLSGVIKTSLSVAQDISSLVSQLELEARCKNFIMNFPTVFSQLQSIVLLKQIFKNKDLDEFKLLKKEKYSKFKDETWEIMMMMPFSEIFKTSNPKIIAEEIEQEEQSV